MPELKNAMELFQYLDKSNCRQCGKKTCLAFAGAVYLGQSEISECPNLSPHVIERFSKIRSDEKNRKEEGDEYISGLLGKISECDLSTAAVRIGGVYENGKLTLKILGKLFSIDAKGKVYSDIHVNPWVLAPFLNYVLFAKGTKENGDWVSFRELKQGSERYPLFKKRCEDQMKSIADTYPDFFNDIIRMFDGKKVAPQFESDISIVLHPLPRVPIMICYWKSDGEMGSSLYVFFDKTSEDNLDTGMLFNLGAGLANMFSKLSQRHAFS